MPRLKRRRRTKRHRPIRRHRHSKKHRRTRRWGWKHPDRVSFSKTLRRCKDGMGWNDSAARWRERGMPRPTRTKLKKCIEGRLGRKLTSKERSKFNKTLRKKRVTRHHKRKHANRRTRRKYRAHGGADGGADGGEGDRDPESLLLRRESKLISFATMKSFFCEYWKKQKRRAAHAREYNNQHQPPPGKDLLNIWINNPEYKRAVWCFHKQNATKPECTSGEPVETLEATDPIHRDRNALLYAPFYVACDAALTTALDSVCVPLSNVLGRGTKAQARRSQRDAKQKAADLGFRDAHAVGTRDAKDAADRSNIDAAILRSAMEMEQLNRKREAEQGEHSLLGPATAALLAAKPTPTP